MRRYLIVDDNFAFAENLAEIVRDQGDEAVVVTTGSHALKLVRERRFDALLTDMRMPAMGGAQLIQEVRRIDPGLAAIVMTAYTGEDTIADAKRNGVLAILPKPVPLAEMTQLLRAARRNGLVAIVEDDVGLGDNLLEALQALGFSGVVARTTAEAEALQAVRPFAALVDLHLPGSPRGEVLGQMTQQFSGLPFLVITGISDVPSSVPSDRIFRKPFDSAKLLQALQELHHHEARR